jgi:glycosyltransferase involved in cell wall biosynthesis
MFNKKVYFIGGQYMGCWYVRCFLPLLHNGWSGNYVGLKRQLKPTKLVEQEMMNADIIVFHRADTNWHHRLAVTLRGLGKKIVFDNDDSFKLDETHPFYGVDGKGFEENKEALNNVVNNFIRNCDLVTCSTEYLAEEYRELNKNVVVLPNCIDEDDWDTPLRNEGDKVRIGIVGSVAYHHDFSEMQETIEKIGEDKRIQLVLFGLPKRRKSQKLINKVYKKEFAFWDNLENVEHAPWVDMIDYFDTLNNLKLDMMIIPRRNNHFNKAKSNVKFLEAAMCEIPVIASSFKDAPYENDIDGNNGILVKEGEDWLVPINRLIEDKELRRRIGKNAKKYVTKNYNIKKLFTKWQSAYKNL